MRDEVSDRVVTEGRIVPGRMGFLLETQADRRFWPLVLDEDPTGFVGVPVRVEGILVAPDCLAVVTMERLNRCVLAGSGQSPVDRNQR